MADNVAQRVTDALVRYGNAKDGARVTEVDPRGFWPDSIHSRAIEELIGELVAAVAELDARTAHVQR